jgi:hypothetical protein
VIKSPEEGGTYFENIEYGQMAFSRWFSWFENQ